MAKKTIKAVSVGVGVCCVFFSCAGGNSASSGDLSSQGEGGRAQQGGGGNGGDGRGGNGIILGTGGVPVAPNCEPPKALDILFVIDNSPSMAPKQRLLNAKVPAFFNKIEELATRYQLDYHLGIVSSDVGGLIAPGARWPNYAEADACGSYEGDNGRLQATPCYKRTGLVGEAFTVCQSLCPGLENPANQREITLSDGQNFITRSNVNITKNPDPAKPLPLQAFQCFAPLGDVGCGMESPLESARRALSASANPGFLRKDSVLAVIFITDEDDCSVRRRDENDPTTPAAPLPECQFDPQNPKKDIPYYCFNYDYRCFARSVVCDEPLNTSGDKHNCREREDNYLEPVQDYVDFFQTIRPSNRLVLGGLWTMPAASDAQSVIKVEHILMGTSSDDLNLATGSSAACVGPNPQENSFFGRPQVRLSKFLRSFPGNPELSICVPSMYDEVLATVGQKIEDRLGCIDIK